MDTYRGYTVQKDETGFNWVDDKGRKNGPFKTDDDAFDNIDRYRKMLLAKKDAE
jgi:hypothetical protein